MGFAHPASLMAFGHQSTRDTSHQVICVDSWQFATKGEIMYRGQAKKTNESLLSYAKGHGGTDSLGS
jgi:hypothetical protein